jgi:hypothetical protein
MLWTLGVWTIRGGRIDRSSFFSLLTNPGLISTCMGVLLALLFPGARSYMAGNVTEASPVEWIVVIVFQAITMVGTLTVPLSLLLTGAFLGALSFKDHRPSRAFIGVLTTRLLLTPLGIIGLFLLFSLSGITIPEVPRMTAIIIASMPIAQSCVIFSDRYGGDNSLTVLTIFYSTLLGIITAPLLVYIATQLGL